MNKVIGFGVAVVLCMAAAGFGAYMALRPQPVAVPAAAVAEAVNQAAPTAASSTSRAPRPIKSSTSAFACRRSAERQPSFVALSP